MTDLHAWIEFTVGTPIKIFGRTCLQTIFLLMTRHLSVIFSPAELKRVKPRMNEDQTMKDTKYNIRPETVVIAGSARLPENITAKHVFGYITIELEIDPVDSTIVDVSYTLLPFLGEKILHNALLGNKVDEAIENAITQLDRRFFSVTKRAVIAALKDAYRWYKKSLKKRVTVRGDNTALTIDA
jgi:hypothetical protein